MATEYLREQGFDVDCALNFCVGSEDIYFEVLETALEEGLEKIPFIRQCVETEDFERYRIEVHGLKNAAKQIGATELSDMALEQENASKEQNYTFIKASYNTLLQKYSEVVAILNTFFASQR